MVCLTNIDYARYTSQIRQEYKHYADDAFITGRCAVMEKLLQKSRLYETSVLHQQWEQRARYNLSQEIASLKAQMTSKPVAATASSAAVAASSSSPTNAKL